MTKATDRRTCPLWLMVLEDELIEARNGGWMAVSSRLGNRRGKLKAHILNCKNKAEKAN